MEAEWQNDRTVEWQNGGMVNRMVEWRTEWSHGGNVGNGRMADRMVELREWREWWNGKKNGRMAEWQKMDTKRYIRTIYGTRQRHRQHFNLL